MGFEKGLRVPGLESGLSVKNGQAQGAGIYSASIDRAGLAASYIRKSGEWKSSRPSAAIWSAFSPMHRSAGPSPAPQAVIGRQMLICGVLDDRAGLCSGSVWRACSSSMVIISDESRVVPLFVVSQSSEPRWMSQKQARKMAASMVTGRSRPIKERSCIDEKAAMDLKLDERAAALASLEVKAKKQMRARARDCAKASMRRTRMRERSDKFSAFS